MSLIALLEEEIVVFFVSKHLVKIIVASHARHFELHSEVWCGVEPTGVKTAHQPVVTHATVT